MKHFTNSMRRFTASLLIVVNCFLVVFTLLTGCTSDAKNTDCSSVQTGENTEENQVNNNGGSTNYISEEITVGYTADSNNSKPLPSQRIALKCLSFYPHGEKITVTAFMGDEYSIGKRPTYDTYGNNGYPVFEVFPAKIAAIPETVDNAHVKINGKTGKYEHRFNKEDMTKLDIPNHVECDISECYSEEVELDLSECMIGESGIIAFSFAWQYEKAPYEGFFPKSLWEGRRQFFYYYTAEDGIYVSFTGIESAYP